MKTCQWCGGRYEKRRNEAYWQFDERRCCSKSCATSLRNTKPDDELSPATRYRQGTLSHRGVMELALGRKLRSDEYVHHVNGNKLDNRIGNLEVVTAAEHGRRHTFLPVEKQCVICDATFAPHKTKRRRAQTCSPECKSALLKQRWQERRASAVPQQAALDAATRRRLMICRAPCCQRSLASAEPMSPDKEKVASNA